MGDQQRYQPIQQDPARRIQRIQRWIVRSGTADNDASTIDMTFDCEYTCRKVNQDRFISRTCRANLLFKREVQWLCEFTQVARVVWSGDMRKSDQTIAEQKARIEELECELIER